MRIIAAALLALAALPAAAADLECRAAQMCRSAACAADAGTFRLTGHDGPNPALLAGDERVALRARVAADAGAVRFEGRNAGGRVELVILYPASLAFSRTRDAQRRNAPVWSGRCTVLP